MSRSHNDNTVGPWAKKKLKALEEYLNAYHLVMKNQKFKLIYIDAFAGGGTNEIRNYGLHEELSNSLLDIIPQQNEFIKGSPKIALECKKGSFDSYYFFDTDTHRTDELERIKGDHNNKSIHISNEDANSGVKKLAKKELVGNDVRAVAFLDPFGPHLHWKTIEALAQTKHVDVIINFPIYMAINRLLPKNYDKIQENWVIILNNLFGTEEWNDLAYEFDNDLIGRTIQKSSQTIPKLLDFYHNRIKNAFGYSVEPSLVKNTRNLPLYYLLWASSHPLGKNIAHHILNFGEQLSVNNKTKQRELTSFLE